MLKRFCLFHVGCSDGIHFLFSLLIVVVGSLLLFALIGWLSECVSNTTEANKQTWENRNDLQDLKKRVEHLEGLEKKRYK